MLKGNIQSHRHIQKYKCFHRISLLTVCFPHFIIKCSLITGVQKSQMPGFFGDYKFLYVGARHLRYSVQDTLYVIFLVPRILRWFLDFWKCCAPMTYSIYSNCSPLEFGNMWCRRLAMMFQMNMLLPYSGLRHWVQVAAEMMKGWL